MSLEIGNNIVIIICKSTIVYKTYDLQQQEAMTSENVLMKKLPNCLRKVFIRSLYYHIYKDEH